MRYFVLLLAISVVTGRGTAQDAMPRLLTSPDVSATQICFTFAGDIWLVPRGGGAAHRLTSSPGGEDGCRFSPDGQRVAYSATRDNNTDIYMVATGGGTPTRLTWHPGPDVMIDWKDANTVFFASLRGGEAPSGIPFRFYTQPVDGSVATVIDLPGGGIEASWSPDRSRLAYMPYLAANNIWKRYRGGRTTPVWVVNMADAAVTKVPRENSNDRAPMWVGDTVFFLSDRDGPTTLHSFDLTTGVVTRRIENTGLDIKSAQIGPGAIAYEQFGSIHLYDLATGRSSAVAIRPVGELTAALPQWVKVGSALTNASLSPTGARAVFEGRGEIITVPAEKGDPRNISNTPGTMERWPAWSPDGLTIAYLSDASGQYQLELRSQDGMGEPRRIDLGGGDNFSYNPTWSPDGKFIALSNSRGEIWNVEIANGRRTLVDVNPWGDAGAVSLSWSRDSRWLSYPRALDNQLSAVFVWNRETDTSRQVTDGMSDATSPVFDAGGRHLFFVASTDAGPAADFSMTTFDHPVTRSLYAIVLDKDDPSPLAPESDEEEAKADSTKTKAKSDTGAVVIDFEAIDQRTIPLPAMPANYLSLAAGKAGVIYLAESPRVPIVLQQGDGPGITIHKFDLKERKTTEVVSGVSAADVSHDGGKLLYRKGDKWAIADLAKPVEAGKGTLATGGIQVKTDPRAEWEQMYREAFRMQRAFFYDPGYHGLDLAATERFYERFLPGLGSRQDLGYLFQEAFGNLTVGHLYVGTPGSSSSDAPTNGLLGADYRIDNDRWRIARVYAGENWNPDLRAPLTQPGVNVRAGEYLLAVNGVPLTAAENVDAALAGTAGKQVVLRVGPSADGRDARDVTVVPTGNENMLRHLAWVDRNRRVVDSLSGGRAAYLYIPNTANQGYTRFNRYFFAQRDKQAAIVDERYNGGGNIADYMVNYLRKMAPFNYVTARHGRDAPIPAGIYGPKVMLINEWAGSGGDELPWLFRREGVGPLVGTRTWGGLVGIGGYPALMDGGTITAPRIALWSYEGEYEVENQGVAPDIEVEVDPALWRQGRDAQLERGVQVLLQELERNPYVPPHRPAFPRWAEGKTPGGGTR
ncbi:MAG: PDZ domain-containing protein [Gemmatimonadales bacterium]|nr:PDZ domain-containing protein [Gemmatimonadales bacterium]MDZ4390238.1 PDZ domain-containing protein [Gemmatimonadales bacterium]